jgi:hypothetical protein
MIFLILDKTIDKDINNDMTRKDFGINLLKGISGSKLAGIITVIAILVAIPLTVISSRQQQQTQQEASNLCITRGGTCINTKIDMLVTKCLNSKRTLVKGLCPGNEKMECCLLQKTLPTITPKN